MVRMQFSQNVYGCQPCLLKKLLEQLGLHCYAVSIYPDELVLEPPSLNRSWIRQCFAVLRGGFAFVWGGLDIIKLTKIPPIYSLSCFSFGGGLEL